jgi:ABC-type amino acid transport substrate-binding protein
VTLRRGRGASAAGILLGAGLTLATAAGAQVEITIGVRADARPMAYARPGPAGLRDGPLGRAGYDGYMVRICDAALAALERSYAGGLDVGVRRYEAAEILDALDTGEVQIVCGPTTATESRLRGRMSSPPVFVAGIGFATRDGTRGLIDCGAIVGYLQGTTSRLTGVQRILSEDLWPAETERLRNYMAGSPTQGSACGTESQPAMVGFATHDALAEAFCAGNVRYYVGDYDIVATTLRGRANCPHALSNRTFTQERYVILGTMQGPNRATNDAVARFFEALSARIYFRPSVLDSAFADTFANARPSPLLEMLFWALRGELD